MIAGDDSILPGGVRLCWIDEHGAIQRHLAEDIPVLVARRRAAMQGTADAIRTTMFPFPGARPARRS